jgi:hypothetical protein
MGVDVQTDIVIDRPCADDDYRTRMTLRNRAVAARAMRRANRKNLAALEAHLEAARKAGEQR